MDRAPDYGSGGYRFKSCRAHHTSLVLRSSLTDLGISNFSPVGAPSFADLEPIVQFLFVAGTVWGPCDQTAVAVSMHKGSFVTKKMKLIHNQRGRHGGGCTRLSLL
jgi:hypothetical protein